jgi:hypothetical protein
VRPRRGYLDGAAFGFPGPPDVLLGVPLAKAARAKGRRPPYTCPCPISNEGEGESEVEGEVEGEGESEVEGEVEGEVEVEVEVEGEGGRRGGEVVQSMGEFDRMVGRSGR